MNSTSIQSIKNTYNNNNVRRSNRVFMMNIEKRANKTPGDIKKYIRKNLDEIHTKANIADRQEMIMDMYSTLVYHKMNNPSLVNVLFNNTPGAMFSATCVLKLEEFIESHYIQQINWDGWLSSMHNVMIDLIDNPEFPKFYELLRKPLVEKFILSELNDENKRIKLS